MNEIINIPDGWMETTLGLIALVNPRESISKGTIAINVPMDCIDSFSKKIQRYNSKGFEGGTKFRNGDTLLARITPCLENGKTAFVDILDENEIGFGSTEYLVFREIKEKSDKHFIYYLSISPRFREVAIKAMTGTSGRQRVQTDMLINHKFYLPKYKEQQSIAQILRSFDDKIELVQAQNRTLEALAQNVFTEWFGKYQVGEELPEGWRIGLLKEIVEIKNGFAFKSLDYVDTGIPIVRTTNFDAGSIKLDSTVFLTKEKAEEYDSFSLSAFDFLLVMVGASIGKNVITPSHILPALQNQNMWNFKALESKFTFYNILALKKLVNEQLNSASGSARDFFRKDHFYNVEILIPQTEIIEKFNQLVKPIYSKMDINYTQIQSLTKTRDELLPKLMSGEIRVNEFKV
jgi:type I restriction enzyme S subunit